MLCTIVFRSTYAKASWPCLRPSFYFVASNYQNPLFVVVFILVEKFCAAISNVSVLGKGRCTPCSCSLKPTGGSSGGVSTDLLHPKIELVRRSS